MTRSANNHSQATNITVPVYIKLDLVIPGDHKPSWGCLSSLVGGHLALFQIVPSPLVPRLLHSQAFGRMTCKSQKM